MGGLCRSRKSLMKLVSQTPNLAFEFLLRTAEFLRALGREPDSQAVPRVVGRVLERPPLPMGGLDEIYFKFYEARVPNPESGVRVPVAHRGGRSADLRALGREPDSQAVPRGNAFISIGRPDELCGFKKIYKRSY